MLLGPCRNNLAGSACKSFRHITTGKLLWQSQVATEESDQLKRPSPAALTEWRVSHYEDPGLFTSGLSNPASWFPKTRAMRRKIIAHMGPTNSGKTYQALRAFKAASSGAYCGPLRLLAWEVAHRLNAEGVPSDLVTGQERRLIKGAKHTASTVEMANMSHQVKVGIIDEVQLIGDPIRGAAFTRAILGLPAEELHVCGDPSSIPLLKIMAEEAGDSLEIRSYKRLASLRLGRRPLPNTYSAQRGDCLVAFSRREVHHLKQDVEARGLHSCCVVYGALPPESRAHQAVLFNTSRTGFNVLAASDAVGMGLNLNIRRIIFSSLEKFDGKGKRLLTPAEVKQIAGRAGRFGSQYQEGIVTCLNAGDMPYLKEAMAAKNKDIEIAFILPSFDQIAMLARHDPDMTLTGAIEVFSQRAMLSDHYYLGDYENMLTLAVMLNELPLTLRECYIFATSPTECTESTSTSALLSFANAYCRRRHVPGWLAGSLPTYAPQTAAQLKSLEALHAVYDLYIWLSYRLEDCMPDRLIIEVSRSKCADMIREGLQNMSRQKIKRRRRKDMSFLRTDQVAVAPV